MIRVVLADDHPVVRTGYRRLLEQSGDVAVVAEAADAHGAYRTVVEHAPDVLVTDLSMAGGGGLALIRRVVQREPRARALVFSMHDEAMLVHRAFAAGARGFLSKASSPDCLVVAVRSVHAGERYLGPDVAASLPDDRRPPGADRLATLSGREFEVFRLLAQGHTAAQCAAALHLSPKTIANLQTLIRDKLGVATSAALAHLAIRHRVIGAAEEQSVS